MVEELPGKTRFSPQLKTLRVDDELVVSRGQRVGEPSGVLTVSTPANDSSTVTLAQLESAYSLRNELDAFWAARPMGLVHARERLPLVMEDPGGPLLDGLVGRPLDVEESLRLAIGLAFALGALHKRGLIHKGIKPANILADLATRQVWLNAFGFCSRTPRESQAPNSPEAIAGTLVYMATEHADRMNPSVNS
jgi:serine/threonine protein kinase